MGISKQSIEDLKKRSKISDFVLSTTTGKLRGTKGMALCPFHGEKTASMSFTDVENLFHCFGCKMGGDIYKYVQEVYNLEFQDAVELVAEKYGFKLTYTETGQPYFDPPTTLAKMFSLRGVPTTILINKEGQEFARVIGSIDFEDKNFINWIKKYN